MRLNPALLADAADCNRHLRWIEGETIPKVARAGPRMGEGIQRRAKTCCASCDKLMAPGFKKYRGDPWCGRQSCAVRLDRWWNKSTT